MHIYKKPKKTEYTKNDFEKDIMSKIKQEFLKQYQELDERFDVDRGKMLKAVIEPLLDTLSLDFDRRALKKAIEAPAIIIYRKMQPNPRPVAFIFAEFHFKQALINNADKAMKILKKLFPQSIGIYVALDKSPEKIKKKPKELDELIQGDTFDNCWTKLYEYLAKNVFGIEQ